MLQGKQISYSGDLEASRPLYTLGVASRLSGIPAHSIRQYVDMGLILPYKLQSKRHLFSQHDIKRIIQIQRLIRRNGLNFAGIRALLAMIPCWAIRKCSDIERKACAAYEDNFQPCWTASEKGRICKNENCRNCEVYREADLEVGIKEMLRSLVV